jgi:hypothetical protein
VALVVNQYLRRVEPAITRAVTKLSKGVLVAENKHDISDLVGVVGTTDLTTVRINDWWNVPQFSLSRHLLFSSSSLQQHDARDSKTSTPYIPVGRGLAGTAMPCTLCFKPPVSSCMGWMFLPPMHYPIPIPWN